MFGVGAVRCVVLALRTVGKVKLQSLSRKEGGRLKEVGNANLQSSSVLFFFCIAGLLL